MNNDGQLKIKDLLNTSFRITCLFSFVVILLTLSTVGNHEPYSSPRIPWFQCFRLNFMRYGNVWHSMFHLIALGFTSVTWHHSSNVFNQPLHCEWVFPLGCYNGAVGMRKKFFDMVSSSENIAISLVESSHVAVCKVSWTYLFKIALYYHYSWFGLFPTRIIVVRWLLCCPQRKTLHPRNVAFKYQTPAMFKKESPRHRSPMLSILWNPSIHPHNGLSVDHRSAGANWRAWIFHIPMDQQVPPWIHMEFEKSHPGVGLGWWKVCFLWWKILFAELILL